MAISWTGERMVIRTGCGYYVENSREEVYDWLTELGVEFEDLMFHPGNSVVRFHNIVGRGLGLVTPIYLACLKSGNVSFPMEYPRRQFAHGRGERGGNSGDERSNR